LIGLEALTTEQQAILKGLVERSNHPIAVALNLALPGPPAALEGVEEQIGKGMCGRLGERYYQLGSASFLAEKGVAIPASEPADAIVTPLFFAENGHLLAHLLLGDRLRQEAVDLLRQLGLSRCLLLSGDGEGPVAAVARQCGFSAWHWGVNPLQKREYLMAERAKGKIVCMIGDGINDAPALTAAHVGISVVTAADISIHVSDLLLTTEHLQVLPKMRTLAIKAKRIVRQNLFWAFFYNLIGIALAMFGWLSPLFAAGAMVASSLIVTLNAQRLKRTCSPTPFPFLRGQLARFPLRQ
jgi:P-type Cu2+ transporter